MLCLRVYYRLLIARLTTKSVNEIAHVVVEECIPCAGICMCVERISRKKTVKSDRLILRRFLDVGGVNSDLLVVLFQRSEILSRLRELTLFHSLTNIPVNERPL